MIFIYFYDLELDNPQLNCCKGEGQKARLNTVSAFPKAPFFSAKKCKASFFTILRASCQSNLLFNTKHLTMTGGSIRDGRQSQRESQALGKDWFSRPKFSEDL